MTSTRRLTLASDTDTVAVATPDDSPMIARLAAAHAADMPWARALLPASDRGQALQNLAALVVEHALQHGHVDVIAGRAAAIWLDHTTAPPPLADLDDRLRAACGPAAAAVTAALTAAAQRAQQSPHLFLAVLAAGRKDGRMLLSHRHRWLDRAGITACVDSDSVEEVALLIGAGYRPGEPYQLPSCPPRWPLRRPPAAQPPTRRFWPPDAR